MSMHKCWSLYNKEEKLRIDDLRPDQVKTILLAIPTKQIGEWYACREGDMQWQSLADVPDFHDDARAIKGNDPHVPTTQKRNEETPSAARPHAPRRPLFEDIELEAVDTLKLEAAPIKERRSAKRYVRNLNFKIVGQPFECETVDVSMGGISLKAKLPANVNKNIKAQLSLDGEAILVTCSRVGDHSVRIVDSNAWDVLRNWIINW